MAREIKWGFIGCGNVVQKKSGRAFNEAPDSRVQAIMRRDLSAAKESAEMFGALEYFDKVEDLLASPDVDAVYIATPPGLHYEQAMACCKAKKPVYIEKPFARNYIEAKEITEAFAAKKVPIFVGHYRRALPRFLHIKKLIEGGAIGRVVLVRSYLNRIFSEREAKETWMYNPELSGGGKFYDIAPHSIDILMYLFGEMAEVHGFADDHGTGCPLEDTVAFAYKTENGVLGTASFNCIANKKGDRVFVSGTKGSLEFSVHGKDDVVLRDFVTGEEEVKEIPDPKVIEGPMVKIAVDDLLGRGVCPCRAEEALPTYRVIDGVLEDFYGVYGGRGVEFWKNMSVNNGVNE